MNIADLRQECMRARLDDLAQKHGKRFLASAALRKLAEKDGKFYR